MQFLPYTLNLAVSWEVCKFTGEGLKQRTTAGREGHVEPEPRRMAGIHPKEQRPFHRPPPRRRSARRRHALAGAIVDQAGGQTTEAAVGCAAPVGHRWQQQPAQQNRPRGHRARRPQELEAGRRAVCPRERIGAPAAAASHMTAPSPPRGPTSVCLRVAPPS